MKQLSLEERIDDARRLLAYAPLSLRTIRTDLSGVQREAFDAWLASLHLSPFQRDETSETAW